MHDGVNPEPVAFATVRLVLGGEGGRDRKESRGEEAVGCSVLRQQLREFTNTLTLAPVVCSSCTPARRVNDRSVPSLYTSTS